MVNGYLLLSLLVVVLVFVYALVLVPRWQKRQVVLERLVQQSPQETTSVKLWHEKLVDRMTSSSLVNGDYLEMRDSLDHMGVKPEQVPLVYALSCWGIPLAVLVFSGIFLSLLWVLVLTIVAFLLVRRTIRARALRADATMNEEAVELCYLMRMFMESGISLERAMRLISAQAEPLIPNLVRHIHRFNRLLDAGESRQVALDQLGNNRNVPVLHDLCKLLKQSSRLGSTVGESLDNIIQQAQAKAHSKVQEDTNKIGAKMSMVMVACMLPALMILIGGPALGSLSSVFN